MNTNLIHFVFSFFFPYLFIQNNVKENASLLNEMDFKHGKYHPDETCVYLNAINVQNGNYRVKNVQANKLID